MSQQMSDQRLKQFRQLKKQQRHLKEQDIQKERCMVIGNCKSHLIYQPEENMIPKQIVY